MLDQDLMPVTHADLNQNKQIALIPILHLLKQSPSQLVRGKEKQVAPRRDDC